jgi:hypothetical protein
MLVLALEFSRGCSARIRGRHLGPGLQAKETGREQQPHHGAHGMSGRTVGHDTLPGELIRSTRDRHRGPTTTSPGIDNGPLPQNGRVRVRASSPGRSVKGGLLSAAPKRGRKRRPVIRRSRRERPSNQCSTG